jgi:hypothetical protein
MRSLVIRKVVPIVAAIAAGAATIACGDRVGNRFTDAMGKPLAKLVDEHSIGKSDGNGPAYELGSIIDLFPTRDGSLWVIDGGVGVSDPLIRHFDSTGKLLHRAGRAGSAAGEYRAPYALAELRDGRIAVRDRDIPERVHVFAPDGTFDQTWNVGAAGWTVRSPRPILVDTQGVVWLPMRARVGMPQFLRVAPTGQVIDSVEQPMAPNATHMGMAPRSGMYVIGGSVAWSPIGAFAVARADSYHVEILPAPAASTPAKTIEMQPPGVAIGEEERVFQHEAMKTLANAMEGPIPQLADVPTVKPPIHHIDFSADGQLMVWVYGPSQKDSVWADTYAIDLFDDAGKYKGRVPVPSGFWPYAVRGDRMWGVFTNTNGSQVVRRYRIAWR